MRVLITGNMGYVGPVLVRHLRHSHPSAALFRVAPAGGWSARLRVDLVLIDCVACALSAHEITVLSAGTPCRPLIDVADMARAIDWAISASDHTPPYVAVKVGSEERNYQVRE